jgi:hypothetical protein
MCYLGMQKQLEEVLEFQGVPAKIGLIFGLFSMGYGHFQVICLLFLPNFLGPMINQDPTIILFVKISKPYL